MATVIQELKSIQDRFGYIPEKEMYSLSQRINVPVYELNGVASFYPHFRLSPPPRATIHVCADLPCHLRGAQRLLEQVKNYVRTDLPREMQVEVKACSCLGQCDGAPAMLINDLPYARCQPDELLDLARVAAAGEETKHQHFSTVRGPFRTDPYTDAAQHYGTLKQLAQQGPAGYPDVINKIKAANLRGMGGAGTPAFRKWDTVQKSKSDKKYIVCNADESEVGTFKDREIMKALPHILVEAMAIAGVACGADQGYIYIRHEYHEQVDLLNGDIRRATELWALGPNVFGSGKPFHLEVFVSPGVYVQGVETALLEALEGRRGQPRNKQWDIGLERGVPAFMGLWGKPTLINNVETFAYVPVILAKGPEWFCNQAVSGCQGLKWVGIGGDVAKPGVFEISMGTTYRQIVEMAGGIAGGRKLKAICPSGPTVGFMPPSFLDVPLDFKQIGPKGEPQNAMAQAGGSAGSASIIVLAEGRCLIDSALNFTRFYRNESCGKCVPCRVGSQKLVDIVAGIQLGTARGTDLDEIERLSHALNMTSICGLGQVVPEPIRTVQKHFPEEVEDHLVRKRCAAGVCFPKAKPAAAGGNGKG
jgi:NADH:ubiquinone oxidoreductase subunit F (NADH-binding)/NADH:ubiquinone oxidoreductase subunit E